MPSNGKSYIYKKVMGVISLGLSDELISQFVKITNDSQKRAKKETIVYGVIVKENDETYVKIDGSDEKTPISTTTGVNDGDRVTVMIKNHNAIVTGNISSPSAQETDVADQDAIIARLEKTISSKVDNETFNTVLSEVTKLDKTTQSIKESLADYELAIGSLEDYYASLDREVTANSNDIASIKNNKLSVTDAQNTYATKNSVEQVSDAMTKLQQKHDAFETKTETALATINQKLDRGQKILWNQNGGLTMNASHTIALSESVSQQPNGIVLVFCMYNESGSNISGWQSFFVPKQMLLSISEHSFKLSTADYSCIGSKYLRIAGTSIIGYAVNEQSGSNNGVTYANNKFVLQYVIGV